MTTNPPAPRIVAVYAICVATLVLLLLLVGLARAVVWLVHEAQPTPPTPVQVYYCDTGDCESYTCPNYTNCEPSR